LRAIAALTLAHPSSADAISASEALRDKKLVISSVPVTRRHTQSTPLVYAICHLYPDEVADEVRHMLSNSLRIEQGKKSDPTSRATDPIASSWSEETGFMPDQKYRPLRSEEEGEDVSSQDLKAWSWSWSCGLDIKQLVIRVTVFIAGLFIGWFIGLFQKDTCPHGASDHLAQYSMVPCKFAALS
jgi:hypothetical protein